MAKNQTQYLKSIPALTAYSMMVCTGCNPPEDINTAALQDKAYSAGRHLEIPEYTSTSTPTSKSSSTPTASEGSTEAMQANEKTENKEPLNPEDSLKLTRAAHNGYYGQIEHHRRRLTTDTLGSLMLTAILAGTRGPACGEEVEATEGAGEETGVEEDAENVKTSEGYRFSPEGNLKTIGVLASVATEQGGMNTPIGEEADEEAGQTWLEVAVREYLEQQNEQCKVHAMKVVQLLVNKGADPEHSCSGASDKTIRALAEERKDTALIEALQPKQA